MSSITFARDAQEGVGEAGLSEKMSQPSDEFDGALGEALEAGIGIGRGDAPDDAAGAGGGDEFVRRPDPDRCVGRSTPVRASAK